MAYLDVRSEKQQKHSIRVPLVALAFLVSIAAPISLGSKVFADQYDDRIKALQTEISQYQSQSQVLQTQAASLQNALSRLANEKAVIQAQVDVNQIAYDKLHQQIQDTKVQIKTNQDVLGTVLADIYIASDISPIEMVASSKNIADYLDKETYQSSVSEQLSQTIATIKTLKSSLDAKNVDIERTLTEGKNARDQLVAKEQEQQTLLAQTNGQDASYQQLAKNKQAQADTLRAEQIAANIKAAQQSNSQTLVSGVAGGGGYPGRWGNASMDTVVDNWSLYNRECVSYVAWKISTTGRFVPNFSGQGNANQWESYVKRYGISSGNDPVVGSAAVLYVGAYGHIMYVEAVSSDKSRITVSEYNYGYTGLYSKRSISSANLRYIYF
jgi:surface antigen